MSNHLNFRGANVVIFFEPAKRRGKSFFRSAPDLLTPPPNPLPQEGGGTRAIQSAVRSRQSAVRSRKAEDRGRRGEGTIVTRDAKIVRGER
jgi:hypothetical protein